jgi:hypothetical protein
MVKQTWSFISIPLYSFVTMSLIQHRDKYTFICYGLFNVFERHFQHKQQLIRGDREQNVNSDLYNNYSRMGGRNRSTKQGD